MLEKKYIPFHPEDAEKRAKEGEQLEMHGYVKTEGFDKSVAFMMTFMESLFRAASKYKRFRMELLYDAESLNVNYCIFSSSNIYGSNDSNSEDEES